MSNNSSALTVGGAVATKMFLATQATQGVALTAIATKTATITAFAINPVVAIPAVAIVGVTALAYFLRKED